jgi:peptide chain release factor subunit 1
LAGAAEFKSKLNTSELFDPRLAAVVVKIVDVSYGGENGFSQAIELSAESLAGVKFIREKKLLKQYFGEISVDSGKFCYGAKETLFALESGAVENLIVWEELDIMRFTVRDNEGEESILNLTKTQLEDSDTQHFTDKNGNTLEVIDKIQLLEWLSNNFKSYGCTLHYVTDKSQEGTQFCRGFGGIGGILRYKLDLAAAEQVDEEAYNSEEDISYFI